MRALAVIVVAGLTLAGCSSNPQLMSFDGTQEGPDEFAILPTRPLQMPPDLNTLPQPTPGGSNITDPTPQADAVAALGGNPAALAVTGAAPAADQALLAYTARAGRDLAIRSELAAEDERFRSRNSRRFFEIMAHSNVYVRAYRPQMLDSRAEAERWRRAGARVPSFAPTADDNRQSTTTDPFLR